jgi:putative transposase
VQTADLLILKEVMIIRRAHKVIGARKLYDMLQPFMMEHSIKMGRDALFDLLAANQLLIKK